MQAKSVMQAKSAAKSIFGFSFTFVVAASFVAGLLAVSEAADDSRWSTQSPKIETSITTESAAAQPGAGDTPKTDASAYKEGPAATWIWAEQNVDSCIFNKRFEGGVKSAKLIATCDNRMVVYLNGKRAAVSKNWEAPVKVDVSKMIVPGVNQLLVEAANEGGQAGFCLKLVLTGQDGSKKYVVTDKSWKVATDAEAQKFLPVKEIAKMGGQPWGDVFTTPKLATASSSPRNTFNVLPGFQVELLYDVPKGTQGSWVCLTTDDKGRLIASDQGGRGLYRITPAPIDGSQPTKVEKLDVNMSSCQGMLYAFGKLYCSVNGGPGSGFYAVEDTNGDDQFDKVTKLKPLAGGGEHGPHAVRLSPDGKSLYVIAGNHTAPPADFDSSRVPKNWSEDLLLPRQWDARGHARGKLAPGGWIAKTDPEGKTWEIVSIGYRNPYDMDFNADGELFAYDADMEWDMGTPWYRPTRVCHATSGSEFGWRSGTGKWPVWYVDSLPSMVDIGPGSPVGAVFGYGTKFPAKYQKTLYVLDWTFGTMYAIHLEADGASYKAVKEEFVSRTPLPLTDAAVGSDGALYFTIGGRGTQSALYRVTYVGKESTAPAECKNAAFADLRKLRREMEALQQPGSTEAVDTIWPQLGHSDRFIRYAARVALEHQDPLLWQDRVLAEKNPQALITATVALARQGDPKLEPKVLDALERLAFAKLSETQQIELLRAYALVFIRMGQPDAATAAKIAARLDPFYPAKSTALNRELSRVLAYLNSPTVIEKTLKLIEREYTPEPGEMAELLARNAGYGGTIARMLANQPEIEKIHFALVLRTLRYGWTLDQRKKYFAWLDAAANKSGGASYQGFIKNIRSEALANASEAEKQSLAATSPPPKPVELPKPKGPGRNWDLSSIEDLTQGGLSGRSFENGKQAFAAARCIVCHRFDGNGGATGPDLTNAAGRFSYRDLADALIEPSRVISDQYRAALIETTKGEVFTGRIVGENDGNLTIMTDPEDATKIVEIPAAQVAEVEPSKVSLMPRELLNVLGKDEVLDLIAYLMSRGNPEDPMFAK